MKTLSKIAILISFGLVAACTADQCGDPNKDGLGTALGCTIGPGYQQQTDALAAQLSQKQSIAAELRAENDRLRGVLGSLNEEERQAAARLIRVNNQIASLDDQLNSQLSQREISQVQYDLLQSELGQLNSRRSNVSPTNAEDSARLAQLESDVADLENLF